ncbi:hypothetical protein CANTEDRAFT_97343 [Yamadazyma tenuis ATCC 10573]|uniref:Uncharacterized protein n=1 Tax=Candida tenuis (strain ATCC 10573 / BCRC 21748 / CBS 615 / JCM 9827 / NBRC 10315 / NRRL Y-1498 / VKM Y-70) TaxID=590646 RepID=G3B0P9_CANTC|nr:uncharacterized protein CANTEDRAFT_97343 [Yamadazyma tenuis ATCC 10573]EGV65444.1 hypothetical protein CANTEDRAFT_97343 [Yamadazyma tenuis ATCC 10573]
MFLLSPSSSLSLFLDKTGLLYLEYFRSHVTDILCVSKFNYFNELFLPLAHHDEAFALIMAAWGGFFYKGKKVDKQVSNYLYNSVIKFKQNFNNPEQMSKLNYYFQICYYLILVGYNICNGDTQNWAKFLSNCYNSIKEYGGIQQLCESFHYSNDVRFLVSSFQYHDIMSSDSAKNGTLVSMEEYNRTFNHENFKMTEVAYGIDSLQGCNRPIYTLLGELINLKVQIRRMCKHNDMHKQENSNSIEAESRILYQNIIDAQPNGELVFLLPEDEKPLHLSSFELYRVCCKLNWFLYIKGLLPVEPKIQCLVLETLSLVDRLIHSKFQVVICLPLLMAGICCVKTREREKVSRIFETISKSCPVPNVSKCWTIVQMAWKSSPEGTSITNWEDICNQFDWHLNVC